MKANSTSQAINSDVRFIESLWQDLPGGVNDDFNVRAVECAKSADWRDTAIDGLCIRILEFFPIAPFRLTAQLRLKKHASAVTFSGSALEVLLQHGHLVADDCIHDSGYYLRNPWDTQLGRQEFTLICDNGNAEHGLIAEHQEHAFACELYVAAGQLEKSDKQIRRIDSTDQSRWFPGPVDGTEVMPLHGHKGNNSMLVRWNSDAAFQTRLDPQGEEILVLKGRLSDKHGEYIENSWIRNPVASWQSWAGLTGTLIYYKNGHFASGHSEQPD